MNMVFINNRQSNKRQQPSNVSNFMNINRNPAYNTNNQNTITPPPASNVPKMKWGGPTWHYLHTMAEKVKDTSFAQINKEILGIVYNICTNLPCPSCSAHAREYLKKHSLSNVRSKEELKKFLFLFHNEVNTRKRYALFSYSDLDTTYASGNYKPIANNFMVHFREKTRNIHLISEEMHRQRVIKNIKQWIFDNIEHFEYE